MSTNRRSSVRPAAGSTVQLFEGSTLLGTTLADLSGNWSIAVAPVLADGVHNLHATVTLGTNVTLSPVLAVTIDTVVAPITPPDMTDATDTGASHTDNLTKNNTPTFTGTAEAGSYVELLLDGAAVVGTGNADPVTGAWSLNSAVIPDGSHMIAARYFDIAGNQRISAALAVVIDTVAPSVPTAPDLTAASDSGVSNSDNITNVATPIFTGNSAEVGSTITLLDGGTPVGTGIADGTGAWTITSSGLADGVHNLMAQAIDAVGNVSAPSAALSVTIDSTAPAAPSVPDLTAASDSGISNTDNITNVTAPTFTGTAESGTTVTLFDGATVVGTAVATGGNWTTVASTLASGLHNLVAPGD